MPPDTPSLYDLALEHDGVFTAAEARIAGFSPHALVQAERRGTVRRLARGVYRLVNFPANEERIQLWEAVLWAGTHRTEVPEPGVLSHLTALRLNYPLLNYVPPKVSITIPPRLRVRHEGPAWLEIHFGNVSDSEKKHDVSGLPFTTLQRTLFDCVDAHVDHRLIQRVIDAAANHETAEELEPAAIIQLRALLRLP